MTRPPQQRVAPAAPRQRRAPLLYRRPSARDGVPVVVHVTAEYSPYARTGGLGEAVAGLVRAQVRNGLRDVVVFMPFYRQVRKSSHDFQQLGPEQTVRLGEHEESFRYLTVAGRRSAPRVVFIDAPAYFDRPGLYGDAGLDYPDNHRRFALLSLAALHWVHQASPRPVVIHAHDWHAGLVPVYLRRDARFRDATHGVTVVFSVHNAGYQGRFPSAAIVDLGLEPSLWAPDALEAYGQLNLLKGGLALSDFVVTVSPTHALELRTEEGGFGQHAMFRALGDRFVGISNGIDQDLWNPATDPHIVGTFTSGDLAGKRACKAALQRELGLSERADVPLFGMTTRLAEQKGFELVLRSDRIRSSDAQFVFLGRGDERYHDALSALARERPSHVASVFAFTDEGEHRVIAGADFVLMPSLYEPCGLTQMRAQRYGAPVVARRVGGLGDTIADGETGFLFDEYSPAALDAAIDRASAAFAQPEALRRMQRLAMAGDFGWDGAAERYQSVYTAALRRVTAK